jgi:DNA-directed RNA polymerase subunit RPC12/RpoP
MTSTCGYCGCSFEDGASRCESCGAPISTSDTSTPDFRSCPYCRRRLLALASPSCSYCGRRLPEDYIKAREADLKRIADIKSGSGDTEGNLKVGELIRHTAGDGKDKSLLDILKIRDLTDLLS